MTAAKKEPAAPAIDFDDDSMFGELDLSPVPVKLGGFVYSIRRDLTMIETRRWWELAATKDDAGCFGILVGDVNLGVQLNNTIDSMPHKRVDLITRHLMTTAGLLQGTGEPAGEAGAS